MSGSIPHSSHRPTSPYAIDVARRIFGLAEDVAAGDATVLAASERIGICVPNALARWFGPYGSLALVARALAIAEAEHSALSDVTPGSGPAPRLLGLEDVVRRYGSVATAQAMVTWLAVLLELLGRLIGEDLASMLLEPCATARPDVQAGDPRANGRDPSTAVPVGHPEDAGSARAGTTVDDAPHTKSDS